LTGSGKDGDGWRLISAGDFETFIVTEIDIRKLDKGFKMWDLGKIGKPKRPLANWRGN
jgi:hypothetical protein